MIVKDFSIRGRTISDQTSPYVIAEISANHHGDLAKAKSLIMEAARAGADAVKMQTYSPDTMTLDCSSSDFQISNGPWAGYSLYELYREAHTPFDWHGELFRFASKNDITLFSTPFDETAVELLEGVDCPAYKIASFELTDLPLLQTVCETGKPIFMSTGMGSVDEIEEAVDIVRSNGNDLLLFHCISSYPARPDQACLGNIRILREKFSVPIGLSDHTVTNQIATASIALGAVAIEKHFKLSDTDVGPDSAFSLTPRDFVELKTHCDDVWQACRNCEFSRSSDESQNRQFRRSLYFVRDLKKGHVVTANDIRRVRPGFGLAPKHFQSILGLELQADVTFGQPVSTDHFRELGSDDDWGY